jgi:[ribosomal protein S5]-alanine N-acetyltransferase
MPGRLTLGPLPVSRGERVILRERRDSDIEDRLRDPTAPGEDDHYGSSWRREWDGRRYHPREHLAAGHGPAEPGSHRWAVEHEGHCIGSAGLRVDADQHCPIDTLGVFAPGLRGQGLGREITRLVLTRASGVLGAHRVELEVLAGNSRAIGCYRACGLRQEGIRRHDFILMAVLQPEKRIRSLGHPPSGPDRA